MCDIDKISKKKDELVRDIMEITTVSGATIIRVEEEMQKIEQKAKKNIKSLSLLL